MKKKTVKRRPPAAKAIGSTRTRRAAKVLTVGHSDVLEREYTSKFRELAGKYGEFVLYERDRAARDIGLHFTRPLPSGDEAVTVALRWFQLKGISSRKLGAPAAQEADAVKLALEVKHLTFWYMLPDPTYVAVYVQALRGFLVIDIQRYVEEKWGAAILNSTVRGWGGALMSQAPRRSANHRRRARCHRSRVHSSTEAGVKPARCQGDCWEPSLLVCLPHAMGGVLPPLESYTHAR
jgi:hypothetical protein